LNDVQTSIDLGLKSINEKVFASIDGTVPEPTDPVVPTEIDPVDTTEKTDEVETNTRDGDLNS